jgi:hypothetical protein
MNVRGSRIGCALALTVLAIVLSGADWRSPSRGEGPETVPVHRIGADVYVGVNDLGRLLDATKFWRPDVRKLVLRSGPHSLTLTVDNPFVVLDNATVWLPAPVCSQGGEVQVPVALVRYLPEDSTQSRLYYDARRERVIVLPPSGGVDSPRIAVTASATRVTFPADRGDEIVVVARSRAHFRVRFGGIFTGALPDTIPPGSLVHSLRTLAAAAEAPSSSRWVARRPVFAFTPTRTAAAPRSSSSPVAGPRSNRSRPRVRRDRES